MKGLVYGSTIGAAYLAARLAQAGWDVEWQLAEFRPRLRPARVSVEALRLLRAVGARGGDRMTFLGKAPGLESWGLPSGVRYGFAWGKNSSADRWVDRQELFESLKKIAVASGVKVFERRMLVPPSLQHFGELPVFLDAPVEDLAGWPLVRNRLRTERIEAAELWLPQGRIAQGAPCQFQKLEGAQAFLEPHPRGGYSLSFYASSRYPIERALESLRNSRGAGPAPWRALFMVNPGARVQTLTFRVGNPGFVAPGAFVFGESLGTAHPAANLDELESLEQAERLVALWPTSEGPEMDRDSLLRLSEAWNHKEGSRLTRIWERGRLLGRLLFSDEGRKYALPAASFLPRALRRFLHAPI